MTDKAENFCTGESCPKCKGQGTCGSGSFKAEEEAKETFLKIARAVESRVKELEKDERVNDSQYYRRLHEQSKSRVAELEAKLSAVAEEEWDALKKQNTILHQMIEDLETRLKFSQQRLDGAYYDKDKGCYSCIIGIKKPDGGYVVVPPSEVLAKYYRLMDVAGKLASAIAPFCAGDPECEFDRTAKLALAEWDGIKEGGK